MTLNFAGTIDALRANFTPATSSRSMSNAAGTTNIFTPSATRPTLVIYSIRITQAVGSSPNEGRAELRSDSDATPTTVRCRVDSGADIGGILSTIDQQFEGILVYLVPKGHNVVLVPIQVQGSTTITIVAQTEIPL